MLRKFLIAIGGLALGCAAPGQEQLQQSISQPTMQPTNQPTAQPITQSVAPVAVPLGQSVKGEPISMQIFGSGNRTAFIMAGIHGDESQSVQLADLVTDWVGKHPQTFAGGRVAILRVANPDGFAAGHRVNAHGVDLNRNFPATNYESSRKFGKEAASQPETRAIIDALDQLHPNLIISIHCIDKGRQCNNWDGPAEAIANLMSQSNHFPAVPTIGYPTPGSLGSYAGIDRKIPMITLELPFEKLTDKGWEENREAVLAAVKETMNAR